MTEKKETNPKDAVGIKKVPFSTLSFPVIAELGDAMLEGARKYGKHNYRVSGVRASVYVDAAIRHLAQFQEGEDIDPDSGLSHLVKVMGCMMVLRDAQLLDNWVDDRPPKHNPKWVKDSNKKAADIIEKYPDAKEPFTENNKQQVK